MLALSREYTEFGFDNKTKDHIIDEKFKTALNNCLLMHMQIIYEFTLLKIRLTTIISLAMLWGWTIWYNLYKFQFNVFLHRISYMYSYIFIIASEPLFRKYLYFELYELNGWRNRLWKVLRNEMWSKKFLPAKKLIT